MADRIIDILYDEENSDNITLYDEAGNPVEFEQIALIPLEELSYVILRPLDGSAVGIAEDEAIVFAVREDAEDAQLEVVQDDDIIDAVFAEYYRLLEESGIEDDEA